MNSWPQSEAELALLASRTAKLLGATFAAVCLFGDGEKMGIALGDGSPGENVNLDLLKEFIRKQVTHHRGSLTAQPKQIQLSRESMSGPLGTTAGNGQALTLAGIGGYVNVGSSPRDSRVREDFGYVVVGTPKALSPKEEVLLMAATQRMSELGELDRMEETINLRNQFLSIASHELKTPLTAIYGVLQLQDRMLKLKKEEAEKPERQRYYLHMVIRQVERLNELIDGLLDVSRIQNGRFMVEPTESDVAQLLQETVSGRLSLIAQEAGVKIQVEAPAQLKAVVDPVRLEEVITNLTMNAIRFSPEGGIVWVKLLDEGANFRLLFRDQGPSVSAEDRERIFHPFERAQRTSRLGGLGLGLFISRQIAQLHNGNVALTESIPGKGNLFEAYFPTKASSQAASA